MSRLNPSLMVLDKGLDLQTAKIVAEEGTSSDMLNYEQVDFQGQKRIDGYTRYDGSPLSALDDFLLVDSPDTEEYEPYTLAFNGERPYGVVVGEVGDSDPATAVAVFDFTAIPSNGQWGKDSSLTEADHYQYLLEFNSYLRSRVEQLPGPVSGLHWFRDRLYAVVDIGGYSPGDDRIVTAGVASLFESRSVQQVLNEDSSSGDYDFGWRFVHHGWRVTFESGRVLYGDLVAKNQNRSGIGVQGPTSIDLDFGSPLILIQKIDITNGPVQVNGWKSSSSPTSYVLKPSDVAEDDASYVYADASIKWDGETGEVALLNLADGTLVEFEASSTVTVEV